MKKIPTIFERDWNGEKSRVTDQINPAAQWVFDGEGVPTRKLDGTSCMVRDGKLFKRRELRNGDSEPLDFERAEYDNETGKTVGWVRVGNGPEDRWHREAFDPETNWPDGTYELIGKNVQGNPEKMIGHTLIPHSAQWLVIREFPAGAARDFNSLRAFFSDSDMEGIVFHHPDGRMAKIKGRDFGFKRGVSK